ncbi:MAG: hypothetical protein ACLP9L_24030 [Thermoguttaceae bacterium]
MLRKFVSIRNVGVFRNSPASGDTELRKLTLVHGDNGRGKTTLCAMLRSLRTGDATLVLERRTLDGTGEPHVQLLIGGGTAEFKDGAWSSTCDRLAVFDADFIAANVYSGDAITHDHKRNLCRVVLGSEGVALAETYDATDGMEREAGTAFAAAKAALQKLVPRGLSLDQFIGLAEYCVPQGERHRPFPKEELLQEPLHAAAVKLDDAATDAATATCADADEAKK